MSKSYTIDRVGSCCSHVSVDCCDIYLFFPCFFFVFFRAVRERVDAGRRTIRGKHDEPACGGVRRRGWGRRGGRAVGGGQRPVVPDPRDEGMILYTWCSLTPFSTALPLRRLSSLILSSLSPQRDCGPEKGHETFWNCTAPRTCTRENEYSYGREERRTRARGSIFFLQRSLSPHDGMHEKSGSIYTSRTSCFRKASLSISLNLSISRSRSRREYLRKHLVRVSATLTFPILTKNRALEKDARTPVAHSKFSLGYYYYGGPQLIGPTVQTKTKHISLFLLTIFWSYLLCLPVIPQPNFESFVPETKGTA